MATREPETPHTREGAGVDRSRSEDEARRRGAGQEERRREAHGDETGARGDRMPLGGDEPGAGL